MNIKFLLYACIFFVLNVNATVQNAPQQYDPLLVVVLMVRDEATVMRETIAPYVDAGITSFFIFDTGSVDDTIEVTKTFFKERGITSYYIEQEPFINFAVSRNNALERAEGRFPNAGFMLFADAEWYMVNGKGLLEFCKKEINKEAPSYMIRILHPGNDFYTQRLIRAKDKCRFAGAVHEAITSITLEKVPGDVFFDLRVSRKGAQKTAKRWQRDKELLLKEHEEQPNNSRTCFYLAQTFECLSDWENAAHYYRLRTTMNGWPEENFMTWYRLGGVIEELEKDKPDGWLHALECFLKAYSMRPHRIEPLIKIARHYLTIATTTTNHEERVAHYALAFLFCSRACQLPYPADDVLFVEKHIYDYMRHDLLGQCAWYIGEYEQGERAVRDALVVQPEMPHLLRNLAFYLDKKVQQKMKDYVAAAA